MGSLIPALLGGAIGCGYAFLTLPPELQEKSSFPAMYAAAGAAMMILATRMAAIVRMAWSEFRGRSSRARSDRDADRNGGDGADP